MIRPPPSSHTMIAYCTLFFVHILRSTNSFVIRWAPPLLSPSSQVTPLKLKKKELPASELINRRKSPALWRFEHNNTTLAATDLHTFPFFPKAPPEIMAPVGGFAQLHAAIANGADAVYLGLSLFSARARATNFSPDELIKAVTIAHASSVKVYVAFNTLIFNDELNTAQQLLSLCSQAGVDAVIVQDVGLAAALAKWNRNNPTQALQIHASTQQTITNADGALFAHKYGGASRVVLGRELSVKEIQQIVQELHTQKHQTSGNDVEVEVFVHGALCVSYSGQCFSSEFIGGRSANRGQCAQACRLPYGLIKDGQLVDLKDINYLLSPQDLCGLEHVEDLVRAGVHCLKIEGRLKDELYVAATTRAYRNAVDQAWKNVVQERDVNFNTIVSQRVIFETHETIDKHELSQIFSRGQDENHDGLSTGFFPGTQHQHLVIGRSPRHRGVHVGRVAEGSCWKNGLIIHPDTGEGDKPISMQLKLGDGLVIDRGMPQKEELGGQIYELDYDRRENNFRVRFSRDVEKLWKLEDEKNTNTKMKKNAKYGSSFMAPVGAHVWKTSDADVDRKLKRLATGAPPKTHPVKVIVSGKINQPLTLTIQDLVSGKCGYASSEGYLVPPKNHGIDETVIRKAIGTFGNTNFILDESDHIDMSQLSENVWCPVSWIKDVRRRAQESLEAQMRSDADQPTQNIRSLSFINDNQRFSSNEIDINTDEHGKISPRLAVLARSMEQVDALCDLIIGGEPIDEIIVDFLEVDGMEDAVSRVRSVNSHVVVASPRIIKPGEVGILQTLLRLQPDGLLVRSAGLLNRLLDLQDQGIPIPQLIGDFSLNAVNVLSAEELLNVGRLTRITSAYDLSANAITELAEAMEERASMLEVIVHSHLPIFHTEHCVFARFLSKGNSYLDCGHACQRNMIHLRDQNGEDNLVLADMGCRNTVFSAEAQSGLYSISDWIHARVGTLRIELVDENAHDTERILRAYMGVISGQNHPSDVWEMLKTIRDSNGRCMSVGVGSLRNERERRAGAL